MRRDPNEPLEEQLDREGDAWTVTRLRPTAERAARWSLASSLCVIPFLAWSVIREGRLAPEPDNAMCLAVPLIVISAVLTFIEWGLILWMAISGGRGFRGLMLMGLPGAIVSAIVVIRVGIRIWPGA